MYKHVDIKFTAHDVILE